MSRLCSYFVNSLLALVRHGEHVPAVACCLKAPRTCFLLLVVVHGGEARQGSRSCLVLSWEKRRGKKQNARTKQVNRGREMNREVVNPGMKYF